MRVTALVSWGWLILGAAAGVALAGPDPAAAPAPCGLESYFQVRSTSVEGDSTYLSLRRLKVIAQGSLSRHASYYLQGLYKDGNRSSTDGRIAAQELSAKWSAGRQALTLGQFKPPFGLERFISDAVMPLADRSQVTDRLVPDGSLGDSFTRDYGIQWEGTLSGVQCALGAFAGSGANEPVRGTAPLLALRLRWASARLPAQVETAFSWRHSHRIGFSGQLPGSGSLGYREFSGDDWREDVGLRLRTGRVAWQGEALAAQYQPDRPTLPRIRAWGAYVQGAYRLSPGWEMAARQEVFDPGTPGPVSQSLSWTTLGATWRIHGDREKLLGNLVWKHDGGQQAGSSVWILQYQRYLF